MCFHTALSVSPATLSKRYGKENSKISHFSPTYHISGFTHDHYPIVMSDPQLQPAQWGMIPYWTKNQDEALLIRNQTLNARSESAFIKPSFRGPILHQRCLVPATGFFDWKHEQNLKIPYFISVKKEPVFSFAGIYDTWQNPESGEVLLTFSILTTEANTLMADIHNTNFRMPVILSLDNENKWLDPTTSKENLQELMRPYDSNAMQAYQIKNDFLKKSPFDPTILTPA